MRTTVDLPPAAYRRIKELAASRGQSISGTVAELATRGLASIGQDVELAISRRTGLPVISVGRPVSSQEVANLLDEE